MRRLSRRGLVVGTGAVLLAGRAIAADEAVLAVDIPDAAGKLKGKAGAPLRAAILEAARWSLGGDQVPPEGYEARIYSVWVAGRAVSELYHSKALHKQPGTSALPATAFPGQGAPTTFFPEGVAFTGVVDRASPTTFSDDLDRMLRRLALASAKRLGIGAGEAALYIAAVPTAAAVRKTLPSKSVALGLR